MRSRRRSEGPARRIRDRDRRQDQPDLRHARVYVSVLGDERRARGDARGPAAPRTASCSAASPASCGSSTRRRSSSPTTTRSTARMRHRASCSSEGSDDVQGEARPMSENGASADARAGARGAARAPSKLPARHPREPRRRRARLAGRRCTRSLTRARQGLVMFMDAGRVPAALRVPLLRARRARQRRRPTTSTSARSCSSTAATSTATRPTALQRDGRAHPQHRPPPRQHALRHGQPRRARGLLHGRDRLGPDARARRRRRRRTIAEALYVGLVTDTGRFMYENTGPRAHEMAAELIEAGVDVHDVYRRLYEGMPVRQARAARARRSRSVERYDDGPPDAHAT